MFLHYLKMAFRSLGKYRMQNLISIVSLAVALFCFSINMYLSRFMIQVDNWLDDRVVFMTDVNGGSSVNFDLAKEITAQRPEIEALVRFNPYVRSSWKKADDKSSIANTDYFIHTDTTLLDVLGLKLIAGNPCATQMPSIVWRCLSLLPGNNTDRPMPQWARRFLLKNLELLPYRL